MWVITEKFSHHSGKDIYQYMCQKPVGLYKAIITTT